MSNKKIGISEIQIHQKYKTVEEAIKHQKKLREAIIYICKKHKWMCQAVIGVSQLIGYYDYYVHNEQTGKRGRPSTKRRNIKILSKADKKGVQGELGECYTDIHLHVLIVSYPSETVAKRIKEYIDKNWGYDNKSVYVRSVNIGEAEYIFSQSEIVAFCNCNYTGQEVLSKSLTLKRYWLEYKKRNTLIKHNIRKYFDMVENNSVEFDRMRKEFFKITTEQDDKKSQEYIKKRFNYRKHKRIKVPNNPLINDY